MQKIDKARIAAYKAINPDFLVVQYHKSYGVDLGGNLTSASPPYWNNDCDTFYAWAGRHPQYGPRENYYIHYDNIADSAHRVQHFFSGTLEYFLADLRHAGWRAYVCEETVRRCRELSFDGTFFDVTYFPWYDYRPENWCERPPFNAPAFSQWGKTWNDTFAVPYWSHIRRYYHEAGRDYLCLPNCDQMVTGWYSDDYLDSCDGAMVEGFFTFGGRLMGADWQLSATRILRYLTGSGRDKVMIAQCSPAAADMAARRWCIANYFLLKNRSSYYNIVHSDMAEWWPEYEIALDSFVSVPADLAALRVAGSSSLYRRDYKNGAVVINPGAGAQTLALSGQWLPVSFSGGGNVTNGQKAAQTLTTGNAVTGAVTVAPGEALILQKPTAVARPARPIAAWPAADRAAGVLVTLSGKVVPAASARAKSGVYLRREHCSCRPVFLW
jgi:hypothetical protein